MTIINTVKEANTLNTYHMPCSRNFFILLNVDKMKQIHSIWYVVIAGFMLRKLDIEEENLGSYLNIFVFASSLRAPGKFYGDPIRFVPHKMRIQSITRRRSWCRFTRFAFDVLKNALAQIIF